MVDAELTRQKSDTHQRSLGAKRDFAADSPAAVAATPVAATPEKPKADTDLAAAAGAYRWTSGFGQGISESIVRNSRGEDLNISVQTFSEYDDGTEKAASF